MIDWACWLCDTILKDGDDARAHYQAYHPSADGPDVIITDYGPDHFHSALRRL